MDSAPSQFVIPVNSIATSSDGGRASVDSTENGGRLTGAAPQPRSETISCPRCGSDDIVGSIRIVLSTGDYCDGETFDHSCIDCGRDFPKGGDTTNAVSLSTEANTRPEPVFCCCECGSTDIEWTAWVTANGREPTYRQPPSDDVWCSNCSDETGFIVSYGFGFELWREAEWSGHFNTFAEALAEAAQSERSFEIVGADAPESAQGAVEVSR